MPPGFNLRDYRPQNERKLEVLLKASPEIADKIAETGRFYMEMTEESDDGLLVTFRVWQSEELLPFILGWGADVEVIEPESLRNRVREEAEKIFKRY